MYVQLISNILVATSLYFIIAASFYFIFASTKSFHLAHAAVISAGSYFTFLLTQRLKLSLLLSIPLALLVAIVVGSSCELFVYRPMRRRKAPPFAFLVASIGLYIVIYNSISLYFGDDAKILAS